MVQVIEKMFGNLIIGAFSMPHAALIAAAKMYAEGHVIKALEDRVIRLQRATKILVGIFTARAHRIDRGVIHIRGIAGCIDLDITAAGINQCGNHFSLEFDDVSHELIHAGIHRPGVLPIEAL